MNGYPARVHRRLWQPRRWKTYVLERGIWPLAFVFSGFFVALVLLTLNRTYDYVDDLTVRDYVRAGAASPFSGHAFSVILGFLYSRISHDFPWYGVFLALIKWITLAVNIHLVLTKKSSRLYRCFFLLILLLMYIHFIMRFSWNTSSILAGGISAIAFFRSLQPAQRPSILKSILLGIIFSLSYAIRRDSLLISLIFAFLPVFALSALLVILQQIQVTKVAVHSVLFLLPILFVRVEDHLFISSYASPEERNHYLAQEARAPVYGYGVYGVLQNASSLLRANRWTSNDVYMIAYAMSMDENKFSLDRFYNVLNPEIGPGKRGIKRDIAYNILHFGQLEGFKWYDPIAASGTYGHLPYYPYYIAMVTLTVLTAWMGKHWYDRLFAVLYLLYVYILNVYMINYLKLPWYVSHSVYTSFCVAVFSCTELKPDNTWAKKCLLTLNLVPLVFAVSGFVKDALLLHKEISVKRAAYLSRYADFAARLGQDAFIFIRPQLYTEYFTDPLAPGEQGPQTNYAALGVSSGAWSPLFYKLLSERGLNYGYQMFPWMVDNPKAYLVSKSAPLVERIKKFIYETYGIATEAQKVHTYADGVVIYRLVGTEHFVPHYQPTYDLLDNFESAQVTAEDSSYVRRTSFLISGWRREVLFQHPPSEVSYQVSLPPAAHLRFSTAVSNEAWDLGDDAGDGVVFEIYIEADGRREKIFLEYLDPKHVLSDRGWHEHDLNLAEWSGHTVTLAFVTTPGPNDDLRYDWAGWGEPSIGQMAYYDFTQKFYLARPVPPSLQYEQVRRLRVNQSFRDVILQHPPGVLSFPVHVKPGSVLFFGYGLDPAVWAEGKGDGVLFSISVSSGNSTHTIFSAYSDPKNNPSDRRWVDEGISLHSFADQDVVITFSTSCGPGSNCDFDWAYWVAPRLVQVR